MKTRLLGALVGLAMSFALPTFAQQANKPDPQLREQFLEQFDTDIDYQLREGGELPAP